MAAQNADSVSCRYSPFILLGTFAFSASVTGMLFSVGAKFSWQDPIGIGFILFLFWPFLFLGILPYLRVYLYADRDLIIVCQWFRKRELDWASVLSVDDYDAERTVRTQHGHYSYMDRIIKIRTVSETIHFSVWGMRSVDGFLKFARERIAKRRAYLQGCPPIEGGSEDM